MPDRRLVALEERFLDARDAHDRLEVARARGTATDDLAATSVHALAEVSASLAGLDAGALASMGAEDRRAMDTMRRVVDEIEHGFAGAPIAAAAPDDCGEESALDAAEQAGIERLSRRIEACYAAAQAAVRVGTETLTRLTVLGRLGEERDAGLRRRLFVALEPVWRSIDADGGSRSPYRRLLRLSAERWTAQGSPITENARALGLEAGAIEPALVAILEAWRDASGAGKAEPIEPWDWWFRADEAERALRSAAPPERLRAVSDAWYTSLGADPRALGIGYDVEPRPGRAPIPVAFTTFGARPRRLPGGRWTTGAPWVLASYTEGGLGELTELVHETGHAIHIAAIRTRPAFADWPDSDALTEALAELTALDTAEPAWQARWLGASVPQAASIRGRYAQIVLDVCWALFEIRLHREPDRRPNDVWTELTSTWLGIAPHPEWSWWAMRGQLVQTTGYMANYAIGAILAADVRAAIRAERGDWIAGDPGWYAWVSDRLYRFGLERSSGAVLGALLGRAPSPDALLAELRRLR